MAVLSIALFAVLAVLPIVLFSSHGVIAIVIMALLPQTLFGTGTLTPKVPHKQP